MGNVTVWVQNNWEAVLALVGGLHVILNVVGKLTKNSAIEGLDNMIMSLLGLLGKPQEKK